MPLQNLPKHNGYCSERREFPKAPKEQLHYWDLLFTCYSQLRLIWVLFVKASFWSSGSIHCEYERDIKEEWFKFGSFFCVLFTLVIHVCWITRILWLSLFSSEPVFLEMTLWDHVVHLHKGINRHWIFSKHLLQHKCVVAKQLQCGCASPPCTTNTVLSPMTNSSR